MDKLKLMTIVGTRPEIIRLSAVIKKCDKYFDQILASQDPRRIRRYRELLEQVIVSLETYDPFEGMLEFPEWKEEDEGEGGSE